MIDLKESVRITKSACNIAEAKGGKEFYNDVKSAMKGLNFEIEKAKTVDRYDPVYVKEKINIILRAMK